MPTYSFDDICELLDCGEPSVVNSIRNAISLHRKKEVTLHSVILEQGTYEAVCEYLEGLSDEHLLLKFCLVLIREGGQVVPTDRNVLSLICYLEGDSQAFRIFSMCLQGC